jgi:hypothetical protein
VCCANVTGEPSALPNILEGPPERRALVTGQHTVANICCSMCGWELGWRYVAAQEEEQRYKVGKYILETKRVIKAVDWEGDGDGHETNEHMRRNKGKNGEDDDSDDDDVLFDSQNEDECEDLFMGIWSEKLAMKRRRDKLWREIS